MKKIICDRCGKEFKDVTFPFLSITVLRSNVSEHDFIDLCNDCKNKIYNYIFDNEKVENDE